MKKERPILFSGEMVEAILDGRKTQTRRVVKPSPVPCISRFEQLFDDADGFTPIWSVPDFDGEIGSESHKKALEKFDNQSESRKSHYICCPYGKVGDLLWVRETWQPYRAHSPEQQAKISAWFEKNDQSNFMNEIEEWSPMPDGEIKYFYAADFGDWAYDVDSDMKPWKPSIHMPREASRIVLEITNVRVERLQEISTEDVIAEGLSTTLREYDAECHLREQYQNLWDKINGNREGCSWSDNPFVWVIEFKRLEV